MNGTFVQLGQHTIPMDSISQIDSDYERTQAEGGGRCVRVWLAQSGYPSPAQPQPPQFIDFRGQQAQAIRKNIRSLGASGSLTVLLGAEEGTETTERPTAKAAGK